MEAETTISEDAANSSTESELPDMVPVSIRSTLPEVQHASLEKVLAGLLLTWEEFLQLFDIRLNPHEFFIRGANGIKSDLTQKIGDYVNSLKKKMKTYPVTLERVNGSNEVGRGHRLSTYSDDSSKSFSKIDNEAQSSSAAPEERERLASGSAKKKLKLLDDDLRSKQHRRAKESLEKIAQSVIRSPPATKRSNPTPSKEVTKKTSSGSRSPTPAKDVVKTNASIDRTSSHSDDNHMEISVPSSALNLKRLTGKRQSKEFGNSKSSLSKSKKVKQKSLSSTTRRSTNTNESINESDESSETDDDVVPSTKDKKKLLKQNVIKYLSEKVSPRSMLRLRNELMALRDQEKYFKVTSVVPMTAGMMEQTFCRKINDE